MPSKEFDTIEEVKDFFGKIMDNIVPMFSFDFGGMWSLTSRISVRDGKDSGLSENTFITETPSGFITMFFVHKNVSPPHVMLTDNAKRTFILRADHFDFDRYLELRRKYSNAPNISQKFTFETFQQVKDFLEFLDARKFGNCTPNITCFTLEFSPSFGSIESLKNFVYHKIVSDIDCYLNEQGKDYKGKITLTIVSPEKPKPQLKDFVKGGEFPELTEIIRWANTLNDWKKENKLPSHGSTYEILFNIIKNNYDPVEFQSLFLHYIISTAATRKKSPSDVIELIQKSV